MSLDRAAQNFGFVFVLFVVAGCSSSSAYISADQHHIAVVPPTKELLEEDRPAAATADAEAHCQKYGKNAVWQDTKMSEGPRPRVVSVYFECAPTVQR